MLTASRMSRERKSDPGQEVACSGPSRALSLALLTQKRKERSSCARLELEQWGKSVFLYMIHALIKKGLSNFSGKFACARQESHRNNNLPSSNFLKSEIRVWFQKQTKKKSSQVSIFFLSKEQLVHDFRRETSTAEHITLKVLLLKLPFHSWGLENTSDWNVHTEFARKKLEQSSTAFFARRKNCPLNYCLARTIFSVCADLTMSQWRMREDNMSQTGTVTKLAS